MALMTLPAGTARSVALRKPMNSSLALHAAADHDVFQHTFSTANSVGRRIGMRATASGCAFAVLRAATPVVPVPANGSRIRPPPGQISVQTSSISGTGLTLG